MLCFWRLSQGVIIFLKNSFSSFPEPIFAMQKLSRDQDINIIVGRSGIAEVAQICGHSELHQTSELDMSQKENDIFPFSQISLSHNSQRKATFHGFGNLRVHKKHTIRVRKRKQTEWRKDRWVPPTIVFPQALEGKKWRHSAQVALERSAPRGSDNSFGSPSSKTCLPLLYQLRAGLAQQFSCSPSDCWALLANNLHFFTSPQVILV